MNSRLLNAWMVLTLMWPALAALSPDDPPTDLPEQYAEVVLNIEGMT